MIRREQYTDSKKYVCVSLVWRMAVALLYACGGGGLPRRRRQIHSDRHWT